MSASSGLRWIDDSQNVGHLVTSPLYFFKANLSNLTLVASALEVRVDRDGDNTGGCGVPAVSDNVELVGISVEGSGSLAGVVLIVALGISFMVISLVTSIIALCIFSVNTSA